MQSELWLFELEELIVSYIKVYNIWLQRYKENWSWGKLSIPVDNLVVLMNWNKDMYVLMPVLQYKDIFYYKLRLLLYLDIKLSSTLHNNPIVYEKKNYLVCFCVVKIFYGLNTCVGTIKSWKRTCTMRTKILVGTHHGVDRHRDGIQPYLKIWLNVTKCHIF